QDAATGGPNRVADGDSTAIHVDLGRVDGQFLVDGTGLRGKSFVEFEQVDVGSAPTGALQRLARGRHRAHAHGGRVQAGGGIGGNARQRLEAQGGGLLGAHHHHGGGAIVQAR